MKLLLIILSFLLFQNTRTFTFTCSRCWRLGGAGRRRVVHSCAKGEPDFDRCQKQSEGRIQEGCCQLNVESTGCSHLQSPFSLENARALFVGINVQSWIHKLVAYTSFDNGEIARKMTLSTKKVKRNVLLIVRCKLISKNLYFYFRILQAGG